MPKTKQTKTIEKEKEVSKAKPLTKNQKPEKKWFLIDARSKVIGRLSTRIATVLLGKNKVEFIPYMDSGDYVVVINAAKVASTGRKEDKKMYYRYSGYPGGLKIRDLKTLRVEKPEEIILHSVRGMLPKTRLGKQIIKKLYVYSGDKHPHQAQKLEEMKI
ncbi:MAG TPA: 50S ribosomal protein L13 [Candidatus Saccharimonadales bacterium]|nr:50S ribosomal protein L13 [Candidatus Saccharimonadales bacterium]